MNEHLDITRDEDAMLAEAFRRRADAALQPPRDMDWSDVVRRSAPRRSSSAATRLVLLAAVLGLLVAASPPFGLAARVYESVAGSSSAPPPLTKVNAQLGKLRLGQRVPLTRGQPPKLHAPDIVPGTTKLVATRSRCRRRAPRDCGPPGRVRAASASSAPSGRSAAAAAPNRCPRRRSGRDSAPSGRATMRESAATATPSSVVSRSPTPRRCSSATRMAPACGRRSRTHGSWRCCLAITRASRSARRRSSRSMRTGTRSRAFPSIRRSGRARARRRRCPGCSEAGPRGART